MALGGETGWEQMHVLGNRQTTVLVQAGIWIRSSQANCGIW